MPQKKCRRFKKKKFMLFLFILVIIIYIFYKLFTTKITNIYISGNNFFTDQEIINLAGIENYPRSISNISSTIEKRLESNDYILSSSVKKRNLSSSVYITIKENYPMFYYMTNDKCILYDGKSVECKYTLPTVINQIPDTIYKKFLNKMKKIDTDILYKISDIKYDPNDVDNERFILYMNDGNYVYINISKFLSLNKYFDILNSFSNKKGILHLDSGEYFEVLN